MDRFTVTGVVFVNWGITSVDCFVVGTGGLSLTFTVKTEIDVPLALVPEMVREYVVFL